MGTELEIEIAAWNAEVDRKKKLKKGFTNKVSSY